MYQQLQQAQALHPHHELIVMGDFNAAPGSDDGQDTTTNNPQVMGMHLPTTIPPDANGARLRHWCVAFHMVIVNSFFPMGATWHNPKLPKGVFTSTKDYILIPTKTWQNASSNITSNLLNLGRSDHKAVVTTITYDVKVRREEEKARKEAKGKGGPTKKDLSVLKDKEKQMAFIQAVQRRSKETPTHDLTDMQILGIGVTLAMDNDLPTLKPTRIRPPWYEKHASTFTRLSARYLVAKKKARTDVNNTTLADEVKMSKKRLDEAVCGWEEAYWVEWSKKANAHHAAQRTGPAYDMFRSACKDGQPAPIQAIQVYRKDGTLTQTTEEAEDRKYEYFKELLNQEAETADPEDLLREIPQSTMLDQLDDPITEVEMKAAFRHVHDNKALGLEVVWNIGILPP